MSSCTHQCAISNGRTASEGLQLMGEERLLLICETAEQDNRTSQHLKLAQIKQHALRKV